MTDPIAVPRGCPSGCSWSTSFRTRDRRPRPLPRPKPSASPRASAPVAAQFHGVYLHALKWSVSPSCPGPIPFIADNVDLGKTIEAGLVLQELILRQQAGFVLIVCPTSASLQWRDEMMRRSAFASKS